MGGGYTIAKRCDWRCIASLERSSAAMCAFVGLHQPLTRTRFAHGVATRKDVDFCIACKRFETRRALCIVELTSFIHALLRLVC